MQNIQILSSRPPDHINGWMGLEPTPNLVSIIIPTFNRAHLIVTTLDSIVGQSYRPVEIIVVDDGSDDETATVVEDWQRGACSDELTLQIICKPNGGAPTARNVGLQVCRGEFIQFFDSDDILLPQKIEDQVRSLKSMPGALFAWSKSIGVNVETNVHMVSAISSEYQGASYTLDKEVPGAIARGVFRRSACELVGPWNEKLTRYQDWEYSVRYNALGYPSLSSEDFGYIIGVHDGPRINQVNENPCKVIECIETAAEAANKAIGPNRSRSVSVKIGQLYSYGMLKAIKAGKMTSAVLLLAKIRRYLPWHSKVRVKNEVAFRIAQLVGSRTASKLYRKFTS